MSQLLLNFIWQEHQVDNYFINNQSWAEPEGGGRN